ncbi:alpha/beta hydrolase [Sinomonas notoginsengisoli]|uniref:alpha/beta fold hydrolase n=1 Tax=Sinomonas notoginsengisoli TaxID=1457311 RepID=UPI001F47D0CB|nr:alpha/beta hydrolase [Sinomonas notoginsengisoli]
MLFDGITSRRVPTARYDAQILERASDSPGAADAPAVVFVHGNVSSSLFWQQAMLDLPPGFRAVAVDLRGFGGSEVLPVDARRGLSDYSDDLAAVVETLGLGVPHLVGWSMGGGVVLQYALDHPVLSMTLQAPVSPYGFGGTAGLDGRRLTEDDAGTGAGGVNPDFVARLKAKDTSADAPTSPRSVYRAAYVHPGFESPHEDVWVASMLTTAIGDGNYPGTSAASSSWPGFAPGDSGVLNSMSPGHLDLSGIVDLPDKPPVVWIHGDADAIVSDASMADLNYLGQLGVVPGWPGEEMAPPQPMVAQTRHVLEAYRAAGGAVTEVELPGCGHSPHLEFPEAFNEALHGLLGG